MNKIKRIFAVILCVCLLSGMIVQAEGTSIVTEKEYELWTQSPGITCGMTSAEARILKALELDLIELYPLTDVGDNYYFAICEYRRTNGGYNGKSDTSIFYLYTLYSTETGFIILSESTTRNECFWDSGFGFSNITNKIDAEYYKNIGNEVPYYIFTTKGKYSNKNMTYYSEFWFITNKGKLYTLCEVSNNGEGGYPYIKDGIMYKGQDYYVKDSSGYRYYLSDGTTQASNSQPMFFTNGTITFGTAERIAIADMTVPNGYIVYKDTFTSNCKIISYFPIPDSDDLYYTTNLVNVYDEKAAKSYIHIDVKVYKWANGKMVLHDSKRVKTPKTSTFKYSCLDVNDLDENYYTDGNQLIPALVISQYAVVTRDGKICPFNFDKSKYDSYVNFGTYNGKLSVMRTYNGTNYAAFWLDTGGGAYAQHQAINEITIGTNGEISLTEDLLLRTQSTAHPGQNGHFTGREVWSNSSFTEVTDDSVKNWWNKTIDNVFPDGRYVEITLQKVSGSTYEAWYRIYSADGKVLSLGPTGSTVAAASVFDLPEMIVWAVNDSKFVFAVKLINNSVIKEYYRFSVVKETTEGEVVSNVEIGEKSITPPVDSDTEVIQSTIDFSSAELPLGYNIKDNVIDSNKLDAILRDQVNSVRLNDIVILAKEGYQSGEQNTGVTLEEYGEYDYSFGETYVKLYTNGQYFRWYCHYPEYLVPGTYSKAIPIGDKTIYVTFKIVEPPTSEGSTTVVF